MLVLGRKIGEKIVIGNGVVITVLSAQGGRVKLGFTGPAEISIHREEIHQKIELEEEQHLPPPYVYMAR
jgi:carbon storage regulator